MHRRPLALAAASLTALLVSSCSAASTGTPADTSSGASGGAGGAEALTVYSGRSETLVGPLLDQLERATGTEVQVRYGESSELAAQLLEEGEATQADLFFSQDAGALGALAAAGRLAELPAEVTEPVPAGYVDPEHRWTATSARARVIAYNPQQAAETPQMTSIDAVLDPKYRGRVGFAPTNASFHSFVTALRVDRGEDGARTWLTDFAANEPVAYDKNGLVLDAVDRGEVSLGLINHYYWHEKVAEKGQDAVTSRIHFLDADDPGALVNVAGAGVLAGSDQAEAADAAVGFLLSEQAQQYFADETAEYPVRPGVTTTEHDLPTLESLTTSSVDLNELDSLPQTLAMLEEVGLT